MVHRHVHHRSLFDRYGPPRAGTPAHLDPPKRLILNGFYHHVRNPIYLGALLVQVGHILWFGSELLIAYLIFVFTGYQFLVLLIEEPILKNTFGKEYEDYMKRVPRWIPRFSRLP